MKKIILYNILILFIIEFSIAQPHISINGSGSKRVSQFFLIDYGGGINFDAGFLVKQKYDISVNIEKNWFNTTTDLYYNFNINSIYINIKYLFLFKHVNPYLGFGAGYFENRFGYIYDPHYKDPGIGIVPIVGILIDTGIIKDININTNISYCKIYTGDRISFMSCNIGLLYYLKNSQ